MFIEKIARISVEKMPKIFSRYGNVFVNVIPQTTVKNDSGGQKKIDGVQRNDSPIPGFHSERAENPLVVEGVSWSPHQIILPKFLNGSEILIEADDRLKSVDGDGIVISVFTINYIRGREQSGIVLVCECSKEE